MIKKRRTRFLIIILIIIATAILGSMIFIPQVFALSCGIPLFTESYERHDLLLYGKLVEKKISFPDSLSNKHTTLIFDTIKVYKGEFSNSFTIKADLSWDDYYREGKEYVIFADKYENGYMRELCVPDYLASPSIIEFLDGDFRNSEIRSLYDLLQGDELKDIDTRINAYSNLNRAEIANGTRTLDSYIIQNGNFAMTGFGALQIMIIVLPIIGIIVTVIFIIRRKRK